MKKKFVILAALLLLAPLGVIVAFGAYYGVFSSVPVTEDEIGPFTLVYLPRLGDYRESSTLLYKIHRDLAEKYSLSNILGFGIYYDNPTVTAPDKLRADLGALFSSPMEPQLLAQLSTNYQIKQMERTACFVATFPYKNSASPMLGAIKVYPQLAAFIESKKFTMKPALEIYDIPNGVIRYIVPK